MEGLSRTDKAISAACREAAKTGMACPGDRVQEKETGLKKLCVKEYAQWRGISESTVRRWIRTGILKYEQPAGKGGLVRIIPV
jgi:hypothetical protein